MSKAHLVIAFVFLSLAASAALAGGSSVWEISDKAHFDKGTLEGVVSFAPGGLRLGPALRRYQVKEVGIWTTYVSPAGHLYVGTAKNASIYKLEGQELRLILKTEELAVTDMLMDSAGNLFAATIPNGKIYRIPSSGKEAVFKIPDPLAWKLALDPKGDIYVASGPKGKVFLMERGGGWVKEVFASKREKNIISMVRETNGSLLLGSADNGILYRVELDGKVSAVHNFPEKEIRTLCLHADGLYVGTNISQKSFKQASFINELASLLQSEASGNTAPGAKKKFKKLLNGKIYHMDNAGRIDQVSALSNNFLLTMGVARDGSVLAGLGAEGRVLSVDRTGTHYTLIDLLEEQVITLAMRRGELYAMGTGHPGTLYVVERSVGDKGTYLSEILDTGFPSVFGRLFWESRGTAALQTRTGNTAKPDETWSAWSSPLSTSQSLIESPSNRFFQFRINFTADPAAVVTHVRVYFTRANRRPFVSSITVGAPVPNQIRNLGAEKVAPKLAVKVKAGDPDGDALVFHVSYKLTSRSTWISLTQDRPLPKPDITWMITDIPDGLYEIRVEASDELANPRGEALRGWKISAPFVIDHRRPRVEDLSVDVGRSVVLRGRAVDHSSLVTRIEIAVDGGIWRVVLPKDRVFDSLEETFETVLPPLTPGLHRVQVRVKDMAGNTSVAEIEFDTR